MITEELILLLLDEKEGRLLPIPVGTLDMAMAGAVLMDLQLHGSIDTDLDRLVVIDPKPLGNPLLDPFLAEIVAESAPETPADWVARLSRQGERIHENAVRILAERRILEVPQEDGSLVRSRRASFLKDYVGPDGHVREEVRSRLLKTLLGDIVPDPTDAALIALADSCDALKYFLDEAELKKVRERVDLFGQMDPVIHAIQQEVRAVGIRTRKAAAELSNVIPHVEGLPILGNTLQARGNLNVYYAKQYLQHGPVYRVKILGRSFTILVGPELNRLMLRQERFYFRAGRDLVSSFRSILGDDIIVSMNGADHARMRRELRVRLSRNFAENNLENLVAITREVIRSWPLNKRISGIMPIRRIFFEHVAQLVAGTSVMGNEYALAALFNMLMIKDSFPGIAALYKGRLRRALQQTDEFVAKTLFEHQVTTRRGTPDLIDDLIEVHRNDPVFMSELRLTANAYVPFLVATETVGNMAAFMLYYVMKDPELMKKVQAEADQAFANGTPTIESLRKLDVVHRVAMETLRLCPVSPSFAREVITSFDLCGYRIPVGENVMLATCATHFLPEFFPHPEAFDIDRYLPERNEHKDPAIYVPYGLGLHRCLGSGFSDVQLVIGILTMVREAQFELDPGNFELNIRYKPTAVPTGKFGFRMTGFRNHDAQSACGA